MEEQLRILVGLGLTLLLVMLRVEANLFGTAEYDEPIDGRSRPLLRRLAWYAIGLLGVAALVAVHPNAGHDLRLTVGDRLSILLGLALGLGGWRSRSRWPTSATGASGSLTSTRTRARS